MKTDLKIKKVREFLIQNNANAVVIPTSDPHLSEYLGDNYKLRAYISGFTGSAGTLVVSLKESALFVDGRYFLQGEMQTKDSEIILQKMGEKGVPLLNDYIKQTLNDNETLLLDDRLFSINYIDRLKQTLAEKNIDFKFCDVFKLWKSRPKEVKKPIFSHDEKYSGKSYKSKVEELRNNLKNNDKKAIVLADLAQIAWLFNIRGEDIHNSPVAISYAVVSLEESIIFIDNEKLNQQTSDYFLENNIKVQPYTKFYNYLKKMTGNISLDFANCNYKIYSSFSQDATLYNEISYLENAKQVKNEIEIQNIKNAHVKDGVAMVNFLHFLDTNIGKIHMDECDIAEYLMRYRSLQEDNFGESFDTICGYNANGAIVHYSAERKTAATLENHGMVLIDSGGQYRDGTTDITRTFSLGHVSEAQKKDYTTVLKSLIALSSYKFTKETTGAQLDLVARDVIKKEGLDYNHGTGHGVGQFLCVHEGNVRISKMCELSFSVGNVTSIEPGIYKENEYGIRLENLAVVLENQDGLYFETLTLCPFDLNLIAFENLTKDELSWLVGYHKMVYDIVSPHLSVNVRDWLREYLVRNL